MYFDILKIIITLFGFLAVYQDLNSRRVSNNFIIFSFFLIVLTSLMTNDWHNFILGLGGFAAVLSSGIVLWRFRVLGGGDVKVMAIMALSIPWARGLEFIFYSLVWGSFLGVFSLLLDKSFLQESRILNFHPIMTIRSSRVKDHKIPFTVGILLGIATTWILVGKGVVFL